MTIRKYIHDIAVAISVPFDGIVAGALEMYDITTFDSVVNESIIV
jgi:hypothetical protein